MSRFIGDEMLESLERRRGALSPSAFESRRVEIERLIASGRAVELSALDHVVRMVALFFGVLAGGWLVVSALTGGTIVGVIIGLLVVAAGVYASRAWGRRRG